MNMIRSTTKYWCRACGFETAHAETSIFHHDMTGHFMTHRPPSERAAPAADSRDTEAQDVGQRFAFVRACRVIAKMHNNRNCACEFCCYLVDTGYWYDGWGKRAAAHGDDK